MERIPTFLLNRIAIQPSAGFRIIEGVGCGDAADKRQQDQEDTS